MEQRPITRRFVLLEHRWNGVHWDFMLETEAGPLRVWAIDEPIAFGAVLLARALSDHRAIYLDYEGPISGGRGTVVRIDGGTFVASEWTAERVRGRIAGDQLVGEFLLWTNPFESTGPDGTSWKLCFGNVD